MLSIGCLRENNDKDFRVSLSPETSKKLIKKNINVFVQENCGLKSGFNNKDYENVGVKILKSSESVIENSDIIISVNPLDIEYEKISKNTKSKIFIGNFNFNNSIPDSRFTFLALERIPRIARAQSMDILSSQASIAGYKSALKIANELGIYLPMMMTAAGTIPPAKILILGAGVAGLQAIATARRLGALVSAFDIRLAAGEQIESLGATFIHPNKDVDAESQTGYAKELEESEQIKQRKFLEGHLSNSDGVITTAAIPGKRAPILITNEMIKKMKPGSVIVDVVAETGGNVELNNSEETIIAHGVKIISPVHIQSKMSKVSSNLYSRNVTALIDLLTDNNGNILFDFEDEIINSTCVTNNGQSRNE